MSRAEIIDGQSDPPETQPVEDIQRPPRVLHQAALGHFENEIRGRNLGPFDFGAQEIDEVQRTETGHRDVDRYGQIETRPPPDGEVVQGQCQHAASQVIDQTVVMGL